MRKKMLWFVIPGLVVLGAALWGPIVSDVEQAQYTVVESHGTIEIRDYAPKIVAQTEVTGERKEAISQGFRIVADYIFGNNTSSDKVAMTAPVMQQQSKKIAMTAPVMQQGDDNHWAVAFVMPGEYTMETLPKPNNDQVKLIEIPAKRFVVIGFSGLASQSNIQQQTSKLHTFMKSRNVNGVSTPAYAFYNPPWTLPFLRRNEIMIEVSK